MPPICALNTSEWGTTRWTEIDNLVVTDSAGNVVFEDDFSEEVNSTKEALKPANITTDGTTAVKMGAGRLVGGNVPVLQGKEYTLTGSYNDGALQANNTTLAKAMINPDGNGTETFDYTSWKSEAAAASYAIQADWRQWATEKLNADQEIVLVDQYLRERGKYLVMPSLPYSESVQDDVLKVKWGNVTKAIVNNSWLAIYAKADGEFNMHLANMKRQCNAYGYAECVEWCKGEAATKWQMTLDQQAMMGD